MEWKGKQISTMGELAKTVEEFTEIEEAQEFMKAYRSFTPHADINVGYISGYFNSEDRKRIQEMCGVKHPFQN